MVGVNSILNQADLHRWNVWGMASPAVLLIGCQASTASPPKSTTLSSKSLYESRFYAPLFSSRSIAHKTPFSTSSCTTVGSCAGFPPRYTPVLTRIEFQPCAFAPAMSDSGLSPTMYTLNGELASSPAETRCRRSIDSAKAYVGLYGFPNCVYGRSAPVVAYCQHP